MSPRKGLDTKTKWLTDRQFQSDLDLECECQHCIHLPQDRSQWQALLNIVTNLGVP
jgi:hypothetical protein